MNKKYRTEFHVHTRYSKDSTLNFYFLYIMCKIKKINCIAITDHNEIKGAIKYKEKLDKKGINVIVGEEIFTSDGEIIGLFLNKKIEPGLTCKETIKKIKEQNGMVYVPHPFEPYRYKTVLEESCIFENRNDIDLIEIHNGRNRNTKISKMQKEISEKYKIRPIIGSDSHTFFELGRNYVELNSISRDNILSSIDSLIEFRCKKCLKLSHFWTKIAKVIKIIEKGEFNELYRIINRKCSRRNK